MRPVRLVMNAFGPYRGKVDLDFTEFGASSIYLISGPTGSGKTTIFDGISYALYNKASSSVRDTDMLKSQFATDEDLCYVELTFEMGPTKYRVKRIPKQRGPGARGNPINQAREVEFYKEDELLDTGMAADSAIETLLGLSYEQFRQIVLLPQGEFRKLLLSSSREKEEIFRNIFGTEAIQNFQETLRIKARDLNKSYEEYGTRLDQSLANIAVTESEALADAIEKTDYEKILEILAERIEEGNKELTKTKQEIEKLDRLERKNEKLIQLLKEQTELETKQKELAKVEEDIQSLQKALNLNAQAREIKTEQDKLEELKNEEAKLAAQLKEKQEAFVAVKKELEQLLEKQKTSKQAELELDSIREAIKQLEAEISIFEDRDQKVQKTVEIEKELQEVATQMKALEKSDGVYIEEIQQLSTNLEQLSNWREELEEVRQALEVAEEKLAEKQQMKKTFERLLVLQETLAEQLEKDKMLSVQLLEAQKQYDEARQEYFGNLAGVLVTELVEDEPCPVCGSIHHPNPAQTDLDAMSKEKLNEFETAKNEAQVAHTKLTTEITQTGQLMDEQKNLLGDFEGEYVDGLKEVTEKAHELETEISQFESRINELANYVKQEKQWRKDLEKAQEIKQENQLSLQQEKTNQQVALKQTDELKSEIKRLEKELTHESAKEAEAEMDKKLKQIQEIQQEAEHIQKALNQKENEQTQIETSIDMLKKQASQNEEKVEKQTVIFEQQLEQYAFDQDYSIYLLEKAEVEENTQQIKDYENEVSYNARQIEKTKKELAEYDELPAIEVLKEKLEETKELKQVIEINREALIRKTSMHESSHCEIEKNYESSKEILKPLAVYKELSEVANGSTNRTNRVSFERYVLSIYFAEILIAANKRFEKMTNNRFELVRREEKTKGGAADGLELNVFDRYSGFERSVRTLSGGETFKASLALALGLSDVIQSQHGGVRVDTLFIDEGFGTLDADSLETAIETLMELQATGRLIGIISHVNELKDRIPARILVENKKAGSHARIEVD